jgi:hypothetical protein
LPVLGGRPWQLVQLTWTVEVQETAAFVPPLKAPWQYTVAQVAAVAEVRVYLGTTPPVLARAPKVTGARPPSTWVVSVMTFDPVRSGWHAVQAGAVMSVVAMWFAWTPTETLVVTLCPWRSTGGEARPVVRLPWQKVQFVAQVANPFVV